MDYLIRNLNTRPLVSLTGVVAIGKTTVAAAVCKLLSDRLLFRDKILFFSAEGVSEFQVFLNGMFYLCIYIYDV